MVRRIVGIVVGLIVAMAAITLVEALGQRLFPPPAGVDMRDPAQVARFVTEMPTGLKLSVVVAWFLGTVAGAWAGLTLSRWRTVPWIVAAGVVAGAIVAYVQIPHPWWMQAAGILLPLLAAWIVLRMRPSRR